MTVDGKMMSERELVEIVNDLAPFTAAARAERPNESPTFFELVTAVGFKHFAREKVDFAAVEVGMGGRLDATNVILPEVSVITRVDYDHEERLGHTLDKIAFEKAGIIKPGVPVVCAPQDPEALRTIEEVARSRGATVTKIGADWAVENVRTGLDSRHAPFCRFDLKGPLPLKDLSLRLLGAHQAVNAAAAVAAVSRLAERCGLNVGEETLRRGLEAATGPARLEVFPGAPTILLDGAHNPISIRALRQTIDHVFGAMRLVLLMGVSRDKNAGEILRLLLPRASAAVFTRSNSPRAMEPSALALLARQVCGMPADAILDADCALERARSLSGPNDLLCITGSFYLAGMLRPALANKSS
jgi:dihydrofolate synthase/folylpolyglutamate synthase